MPYRAVIFSLAFSSRFQLSASLHLSFCLLLLSLLAQSVHAQEEQQNSSSQSDEVIRINTNLIPVPVVVTDERGRRVPGLAKTDFVVRDGGQQVDISYFAAGAERVALVFLLDASGSVRDIISQQQETAFALFSRFGPTSRVAVFQFDERPKLVAPLLKDSELANNAFQFPVLPNRRTAIFDAALAATQLFKSNNADRTERRIAILISDGLDNASRTRPQEVISNAQAEGVSFYVIHLPLYTPIDGRLAPRPASKGFRDLAEKTGGRYFIVGDAESSLLPNAKHDLGPVFNAIAEDIMGQYMLGYHSKDTEGDQQQQQQRPRRIEVTLTSQPKRKLRLRMLRNIEQ